MADKYVKQQLKGQFSQWKLTYQGDPFELATLESVYLTFTSKYLAKPAVSDYLASLGTNE